MLAKGFIRNLTLVYKALIFKVLKKGLLVDRKLLVRYIVNYKALNINIVKNRYLLPLMLELKDRI